MRELEAKFKVDSHDGIRQRLKDAGAQRLGTVLEHNRIYDRADGSLRGRGAGLRLRTNRPGDAGPPVTTLTFKGPVERAAFKLRDEFETQIEDAAAAANILRRLGFVVILTYEKRRESWRHGGCRIELDQVPVLGPFVEVEGPDEASIRRVQHELGLSGVRHEPASYVRMLLGSCQAQHIDQPVFNIGGDGLSGPADSAASSP